MHLKNVAKQITIAGTLLIWLIKFLIRPFFHIPHHWKPMLGIAPNLIGSFLLPFGACWLFQRVFRMQTVQQLRHACTFGLMLVICNEFLQLIPIFGRTFDLLDIVFSFVGVAFGYLSFARLLSKETQWQTYA